MNYTLKRKDVNIAVFSTQGQSIVNCIIDKMYEDFLPLPLKRLVKPGYKEEFVSAETDEYYEINEEGCFLIDEWFSNREIPVNRYNYSAYIKKGSNPRKWLFENNGYSFNDCYYIESEQEELSWNDIQNKLNSLDVYFSVKKDGHFYKGQNATLGGQLEKFWYKKDNEVMLCKKIDMQYDILIIREIIASLIYKKQNYENFCDYHFVYNRDGGIIGCSCKSFTNENTELITAYDLLAEYNMTQVDDVWEKIIELSVKYGANEQEISNYLDVQTLVDYLITNRDRHQNNIGFLRDVDTLEIIGPAPIYDNGSSKYMEGTYPEKVAYTTTNGLYLTELECLKHVHNFDILDISKLPSKEEIEKLLSLSKGLTIERKEYLLNMYTEKKTFLCHLQQQYQSGIDMQSYLEKYRQNENEEKNTWDCFEESDIYDYENRE